MIGDMRGLSPAEALSLRDDRRLAALPAMTRQFRVRADDKDEVLEAVRALAAVATCDRKRRVSQRMRPVGWVIKVRRVGAVAVIFLDCLGYTDVPYIAKGSDVLDEPLLLTDAEQHAITIATPTSRSINYPEDRVGHDWSEHQAPRTTTRLAEGFAMMEGFTSARDRAEHAPRRVWEWER